MNARSLGSDARRRQTRPVFEGGMSLIGTWTMSGCPKYSANERTVGWTTVPRAIRASTSYGVRGVCLRRRRRIGRPLGVARDDRLDRLRGELVERRHVVVGEVLDRHLLSLGEAMATGDLEHPGLAREDRPDDEIRAIEREPRRDHVHLTTPQGSERIVEEQLALRDLATGMAPLEGQMIADRCCPPAVGYNRPSRSVPSTLRP
jgi:hypothetical protein